MLAAIMFALNNATTRRGVLTGTVLQALAITVPMGVPLFFLLLVAFGQLGAVAQLSWYAIFLLSVAGVLHFVWGRYCNYRASKAIGANLQGPASQSDIVITLALAMWVLDEKLTPLRVLGILLVISGPLLTVVGDLRAVRNKQEKPTRSGFQPAYLEGYLFAVLSGTGYGLSPIIVRLALRDTGLGMGGGLAGAFVSYLAAALFICLFAFIPGRLAHVRQLDARTAKWFMAGGLTVMLSQMFRYLALSVAPVSVVQPIQRLSLVFRFFFGYLLNRDHEVFSRKVWVSTAVSLVGAIILSLTAEQVTAFLPLPEWLADVLKIEWP